jgi:hypothetical protein
VPFDPLQAEVLRAARAAAPDRRRQLLEGLLGMREAAR